jgi:hypothetical protein
MKRSYRVIFQGAMGKCSLEAASAKEAGDLAAKALQNHDLVTVEDPDGQIISLNDLLAITRAKPVETE